MVGELTLAGWEVEAVEGSSAINAKRSARQRFTTEHPITPQPIFLVAAGEFAYSGILARLVLTNRF
jgi:hypothetical protein